MMEWVNWTITYRIAQMILEGMCEQANQSYLAALRADLKKIRLLYERGEMSEEDYKRLEAKITKKIGSLSFQQKKAPSRALDIRL